MMVLAKNYGSASRPNAKNAIMQNTLIQITLKSYFQLPESETIEAATLCRLKTHSAIYQLIDYHHAQKEL